MLRRVDVADAVGLQQRLPSRRVLELHKSGARRVLSELLKFPPINFARVFSHKEAAANFGLGVWERESSRVTPIVEPDFRNISTLLHQGCESSRQDASQEDIN